MINAKAAELKFNRLWSAIRRKFCCSRLVTKVPFSYTLKMSC